MQKLPYSDPNRWLRRGKASNYIQRFKVQPGDRFVLCVRVSHRQNRSHLKDQERTLRNAVRRGGGVVVDVAGHVGSGYDPIWLVQPAADALELGATLLAESTDRFIRSREYHSAECPDAQATDGDLAFLEMHTPGVQLMTLIHPDAMPKEVRSYQRKRGQHCTGKSGGRPPAPGYLKNRREQMLDAVLKLRSEGKTYRAIQTQLEIPFNTARRWVEELA